MGWVSNIDMMWLDPKIAYCLDRLASFSRLIVFDKRGTGLSDRVNPTCSLYDRMDDILCVMDAAGCKKAVIFGHSEGGTISTLFTATYPERTLKLINASTFVKRIYSPDYPWAPNPIEREEFYNFIRDGWGNGRKMGLEVIMPSAATEKGYYEWFASYLRSAASPNSALALARMNTNSDVTSELEKITVPTLVIHREDDIDINVAEAKYMSERIAGSKLVILPGNDHCFWVGDAFAFMAEIEEFVTGVRPTRDRRQIPISNPSTDRIDLEAIMLQNFKYNIKLVDFAKLSGRSLSSFKRDFYKQFKTTPSKWLKQKRLEHARVELVHSDMNVNEIAIESGFQNSSHFIKSFKEKYGTTPHQYKMDVAGR